MEQRDPNKGVDTEAEQNSARPVPPKPLPKEIGGVTGPEPTRYGDWEHKGRCTDF
jgi:hypothetical protein